MSGHRRDEKAPQAVDPAESNGEPSVVQNSFAGLGFDATDYEQVCSNLAAFFDLLQEWARRERAV
jgi:hypothetical protein